MPTAKPTQLENDAALLSVWITSAREQSQHQVDNMGNNFPFAWLASLAGTISLQSVFGFLILWVPASFVLWLLWVIWASSQATGNYLSVERQSIFRQYDELAQEKKQLGLDTTVKRLIPSVRALAAIYIVSLAILALIRGGLIAPYQYLSIWPPFVTGVVLTSVIIAGPLVLRRLRISRLDMVLELRKSRFASISLRRLLLILAVICILAIVIVAVSFGLPIWALVVTWDLYSNTASALLLLLVLALQILMFALFLSYLTHLYARTELTNCVVNLSNLDLRVTQILGGAQTSAEEITTLRNQYYETIKYRFVRGLMFGIITMYVPVLNEAYVRAREQHDS
jgi:TRAP-type C4-dicarboxylate transport system permease small subunit